jgi:hypothetical protein
MMAIQVILIIFFLFAIFKVLSRYRNGGLAISESALWVVFWLLAVIVVFSPNYTVALAKFLGVGRGVDAVVYLSVALLFFIVFRIFVRLEKIEHQITKLVRQNALKDKNKPE